MKWLSLHLWVLNTLLVTSAWAQPSALDELKANKTLCYGREYLDHEITANAGQLVKQIRVSLNYEDQTDSISMSVKMTLLQQALVTPISKNKNSSLGNYETELNCLNDPRYDGYLLCSSPCFEGGAVVSWDSYKRNINTLFFVNLGVPLRRCTSEDMLQFADFKSVPVIHLPNSRGNKRFTLFALPDAFCR